METPIITSGVNILTVQNLVVVELLIWKQAYGWMHPVLKVEKVFLVFQK